MVNKIIMYILIFGILYLLLNHCLGLNISKEGMDNSCKSARSKLLSQKKEINKLKGLISDLESVSSILDDKIKTHDNYIKKNTSKIKVLAKKQKGQ